VDTLNGANGGMTRAALVVECNAHHTEAGRSSDELVRAGHALALEKNLRIAVHMSGGTLSMNMGFTKYRRQTGRSDVEYLEGLGVLDHRWLLKHCIHFSDEDIAIVALRGASAVYTPTSEAIRGGGFGHWRAMRDAGVNCTLGTDGPAVDYSVDMVEQMKACCYLLSVRYGDPELVSPSAALEMATINAARALGLDHSIGSLEVGKQADLVLFDRDRAHLRMVRDPVTAFVRASRGADARLVVVNGCIAYEDGDFPMIPHADAVMADARARARTVARAAGFEPLAVPRWPAPAV
jgi:5-methylthioadenosine/S-adenosylhomocysteine deaminase